MMTYTITYRTSAGAISRTTVQAAYQREAARKALALLARSGFGRSKILGIKQT